MGILQTPGAVPKTPATTKRKPGLDLSALKPLTTTGTRNFAGYRDPNASPTKRTKGGKAKNIDDMDSDADDDDEPNAGAAHDDDVDIKTEGKGMLSPEDVARQGELAEGVRKIKVCPSHELLKQKGIMLTPNSSSAPTLLTPFMTLRPRSLPQPWIILQAQRSPPVAKFPLAPPPLLPLRKSPLRPPW